MSLSATFCKLRDQVSHMLLTGCNLMHQLTVAASPGGFSLVVSGGTSTAPDRRWCPDPKPPQNPRSIFPTGCHWKPSTLLALFHTDICFCLTRRLTPACKLNVVTLSCQVSTQLSFAGVEIAQHF